MVPRRHTRGEVAGVVYGSRDVSPDNAARGILPLEAQFVQLLAAAVSTGLARVAQEAEAARARVQFEQFFSPELAGALERDRGILGRRGDSGVPPTARRSPRSRRPGHRRR